MDKILALRDKHSTLSIETLEETYKRSLFALKDFDCQQERRLAESNTKIEEVRAKNLELKKNLTQEESKLSSLRTELSNHNEILKNLEDIKLKLNAENRLLESEKDTLNSKNTCPNVNDEEVLENGNKKLNYYRDLTGIRWDYQAKSLVKGFIKNKQTNYLRPFEIDLDDPKLEEKLWTEIGKSMILPDSE